MRPLRLVFSQVPAQGKSAFRLHREDGSIGTEFVEQSHQRVDSVDNLFHLGLLALRIEAPRDDESHHRTGLMLVRLS